MGIKKYIFASLLLIIIVAGYTFSIEAGDYRLEILDMALVLPTAVWIVSPLILLFAATILHMLYYNFKNYMSKRALIKDEENLIELLKDVLLNKQSSKVFKSKELKDIGAIISQLNITPKSSEFSSSKEDVNNIIQKILKINSGEYVPAKELKLDDSNTLMQKNILNKIKLDDDFCLDVLKKSEKYGNETIKEAFNKLVDTKSITTIKKQLENIDLDLEMTKKLLNKDSKQQENFSLSNDEIINIIKKVEFTKEDFINMAKSYKTTMLPDQLIKLFEDISSFNDTAMEAYLYILFEFEMIDNVREIIANSSKDEYLPYKALLDLKDAGKHYSLDSICYN